MCFSYLTLARAEISGKDFPAHLFVLLLSFTVSTFQLGRSAFQFYHRKCIFNVHGHNSKVTKICFLIFEAFEMFCHCQHVSGTTFAYGALSSHKSMSLPFATDIDNRHSLLVERELAIGKRRLHKCFKLCFTVWPRL